MSTFIFLFIFYLFSVSIPKLYECLCLPNPSLLSRLKEHQTWCGCISHHEATFLLSQFSKEGIVEDKRIKGKEGMEGKEGKLKEIEGIEGSIDLSLTTRKLFLDSIGVALTSQDCLEEKYVVTRDELEEVCRKRSACFALFDDGSKPWQISTISSSSNRPASLCPPLSSGGAPTLVLGGFTMHRISGENINPESDTAAKLCSVPISPGSRVLDTCMGLGYTAIAAGRSASEGKVTTIEFDFASLEMSAYNPHSRALFDGSLPIEILQGDSCEIIKEIKSSSFDVIIHDPPARALCSSDLYGLQFYRELRRVLRRGGNLFHYIGNPKSKESGRLYKGISARLAEAGFNRIELAEKAFGLTAVA